MMRGGHGSAMSDGALNNNDNFRSTQKLRRHDCEDGSAENQVDSATKAADVYASPVYRGRLSHANFQCKLTTRFLLNP